MTRNEVAQFEANRKNELEMQHRRAQSDTSANLISVINLN